MSAPSLLKTPLHEKHVELGARMMAFGGFDMPVQYSGIIEEHMAVRQEAGLFDISHMGEVYVRGPAARSFIQQLVTNDVEQLHDARAMYTVMCTPSGGIVDDLLVYRVSEEEYMLVINAANIEKDYDWMQSHNTMGAELENASAEVALLAVQGPASPDIVAELTDEPVGEMKYYRFLQPDPESFFDCEWAVLSRTGYTGEIGFELYLPAERAPAVWNAVLSAGEPHGLKPAGLGARDTLRLEAGLCLYGNDIDEDTHPLEAGLDWLVKFDKGDFIGRDALEEIRQEGPDRQLVGFVVEERGIPRSDYLILNTDEEEIGIVTSGSQSPVLDQGIGLGYVPRAERYTTPGSTLLVESRRRLLEATVRTPPFHKK